LSALSVISRFSALVTRLMSSLQVFITAVLSWLKIPHRSVTTGLCPLVVFPFPTFGLPMHFQLSHEAERRWVLVLQQIELTRIAVLVRAAT
jgi:hypothetical protein